MARCELISAIIPSMDWSSIEQSVTVDRTVTEPIRQQASYIPSFQALTDSSMVENPLLLDNADCSRDLLDVLWKCGKSVLNVQHYQFC